jgi:hypothetical protein
MPNNEGKILHLLQKKVSSSLSKIEIVTLKTKSTGITKCEKIELLT